MSYRGNNNQFNNQFGNGGGSPNNLGPVAPSKTPLEHFEAFSKKTEDLIDQYFSPLKPYVPAIGRSFIVATFYEDSIRIFSQWHEQIYYLHNYRHMYKWFTMVFLFVNVSVMIVASTLLIVRKQPLVGVSALVAVVLFQGLAYGLVFDAQFILRNLSVVGGLILAFSDTLVRDKRSMNLPGLPMLQNTQDNKKYFLLAGRLLLILLFLGFVFSGTWSLTRLFIILIGFVSCGSIIVGYKTKFAAFVLTVLLFTFNMFVNTFWQYGPHDSQRDFLKYEFFQTLSIVGGLLIIVNAGAGELSIDEKKKIY